MNRTAKLVAVFALGALSACSQAAGPREPVVPSVVVQTPDNRVTFETVDLELVATHPRVQDEDFVVMEVLTPKGKTHVKERVALDAEGTARLRLPIRGTHIEDRAMAGEWSVLVTYNHATTPFAAIPFEIAPN